MKYHSCEDEFESETGNRVQLIIRYPIKTWILDVYFCDYCFKFNRVIDYDVLRRQTTEGYYEQTKNQV